MQVQLLALTVRIESRYCNFIVQDLQQEINQGNLNDQRSDQLGNQIEQLSDQIVSVT